MKQRGFTLVEMLVTLVLVGMISTLLWQALGQVARIEGQLADTRVLGEREALQRAWLQQALTGVATGPVGDANRFVGSAQRLESYTTMPPWPVAGGLERMVLELRRDERDGVHTSVLALRGGGEPLPLWRWRGPGQFEYLGADDRWQAQWPPGGGSTTALPRAIRLRGPEAGSLWVPVPATQNPMIGRRDALQDDIQP